MLTITNQSALRSRNKNIIYSRPSFFTNFPLLVPSSSSSSPLLLETAAIALPSVASVPPPVTAPVPPPITAPTTISAVSPPIPVSAPVSPLRSLLLYLVFQVSQATAGWVRA